jgi:RNA-binding protein YlmH
MKKNHFSFSMFTFNFHHEQGKSRARQFSLLNSLLDSCRIDTIINTFFVEFSRAKVKQGAEPGSKYTIIPANISQGDNISMF